MNYKIYTIPLEKEVKIIRMWTYVDGLRKYYEENMLPRITDTSTSFRTSIGGIETNIGKNAIKLNHKLFANFLKSMNIRIYYG